MRNDFTSHYQWPTPIVIAKPKFNWQYIQSATVYIMHVAILTITILTIIADSVQPALSILAIAVATCNENFVLIVRM